MSARTARLPDYDSFWPHYLREHSTATCRHIHYVGTLLSFIPLAMAAITFNPLWLLGWPLIGYGFAWAGHFFVEKNRPATFVHPLWSLFSDYRMLFLWMTGRLGPHLAAAGIKTG